MFERILKIVTLCLIVTQIGCSSFSGPRQNRNKPRPDLPEYSIEEQQRRGRDKYAIPEDDFRVSPPTFIGRPSPTGR
jgi:hypothetical protein